MRRILTGLVALLVSSMTLFAERVSSDDAALVANNFMQNTTPRRMVRRMAATTEENQNQFYVYQNESGEGWVIIAANDVVRPVLAYSETGEFRMDNMPSNLRHWMGKYNQYIARLEADSVQASEETANQWKALRGGVRKASAKVIVGPLVKTKWDQDNPYYNLCPGSGKNKAYTGCVATAMAQIMKYWEWPVTGNGSHSYRPLNPNTGRASTRYKDTLSANFGNTTYDWENMLNNYTSMATSVQKSAVATLMYHCGVATEMMYGNDDDGGSGTYTVNYGDWKDNTCAQNAFWNYFRYKKEGLKGYMRDGYKYGGHTYYEKWTDDEWTAMVKNELDNLRPILYSGASDEGGHCFVCDGYNSDDYFHFNWGWSGANDGYFMLSDLVPGSGGAGGGGYDFSEDQDVVIGIEPDRTQAIEHAAVETEVIKMFYNGQVVILRDKTMYNLMGQIIR